MFLYSYFYQVYYPTESKGKKLDDFDAGKAHILTAEGDGAMPHHITAAVTTQGAGKFIFILCSYFYKANGKLLGVPLLG